MTFHVHPGLLRRRAARARCGWTERLGGRRVAAVADRQPAGGERAVLGVPGADDVRTGMAPACSQPVQCGGLTRHTGRCVLMLRVGSDTVPVRALSWSVHELSIRPR